MSSIDPLADIAYRSRQAQRENEQLRRDLTDEQDRRRKAQRELTLLRERLTRTLDRLDADEEACDRYGAGPDFATGVDHVIHTIRKELER